MLDPIITERLELIIDHIAIIKDARTLVRPFGLLTKGKYKQKLRLPVRRWATA